MALVGKSLDINTALRAACGAAKMLALSEGVECPYEIDNEQFKDQCPKPFNPKLPYATVYEELQRIYVFLRAIQQGIQPPINIARLPESEEKEFVDKINEVTNKFNSLPNNKDLNYVDYFFSNVLYIDPAQKDVIFTKLHTFVQKETPIIAYSCKKKASDLVSDHRLLTWFKEGITYTKHKLEDTVVSTKYFVDKYVREKGFMPGVATAIFATTDINKISINCVGVDKLKLDDSIPAYIDLSNTQTFVQIRDTYYILLNKSIYIRMSNLLIVDMRIQSEFAYFFDKDMVNDVQPYLMYLLQMDPWASTTFMAKSFGGNMTPAAQYPLAFYIVAHFVANQPLYAKNPADFYRKPIAEKKSEMLAALTSSKSKAELTQRIADGYIWLGEPNPGIGKVMASFGASLFNVSGHRFGRVAGKVGAAVEKVGAAFGTAGAAIRGLFTRNQTKPGQKGGKRVTRKVRHHIEIPL